MTHLPKTVVLANCTHLSIARGLRMSGRIGSVASFQLFDLDRDKYEVVLGHLDAADLIVTIEHGDSFRDLATTALKERYGAKVLTLATPFFAGYAPDLAYIRRGSLAVRNDDLLGDYHSAVLLNEVRNGLTRNETVARYVSGESLAELDLKALWDRSLAELRRREDHVDVRVSDIIEAEAKKQHLFLSFNHPSHWMISAICQRILNRALGGDENRLLLPASFHNLYHGALWPALKATRSANGLDFDMPPFFKADRKSVV